MTIQEFYDYLKQGIVYLDGATGSNLQKMGMPADACTEKWICENEEVMIELQKQYIAAGSNILYAPTFSANRIKLQEYGLQDETVQLNKNLVAVSKKAAEGKALVAGDLTMTGQQLEPLGTVQFEQLIEVYKEQIQAIEQAGADLFVVETMMSLQETRAALIAAKEVSECPIIATMSFGEDGRTLYGTDAVTAAVVLESLGAAAIGMNCSAGPDHMIPFVKQMKQVTNLPIIAKPNAGMPKLGADGCTEYDMDAKTFASYMKGIVEAGASIIGGCCGTTPDYIRKTRETVGKQHKESTTCEKAVWVTSERKTITLQEKSVIGNISNIQNEELVQEWIDEEYDTIYDIIDEAIDEKAEIFNVCVDGNKEEPEQIMQAILQEITSYTTLPLMFESEHESVLETALRRYPGRACINSRTGNRQMLEKLSRKYGAVIW